MNKSFDIFSITCRNEFEKKSHAVKLCICEVLQHGVKIKKSGELVPAFW